MPTLKPPQQCGGDEGTSKQFRKIVYFMLGNNRKVSNTSIIGDGNGEI